jgi:hypothetical protein
MTLFKKIIHIKKDASMALGFIEGSYKSVFGEEISLGSKLVCAELLREMKIKRGLAKSERGFMMGIINVVALESLLSWGQDTVAVIDVKDAQLESAYLELLADKKVIEYLDLFKLKVLQDDAFADCATFENRIKESGPKTLAVATKALCLKLQFLSGRFAIFPYIFDDGDSAHFWLPNVFRYKVK